MGRHTGSGKLLGAAALFFSIFALAVPTPEVAVAAADDDNHWVPTWTSMPQEVEPDNLPPNPFVCRNDYAPAYLSRQLSDRADRESMASK